MIKSKKFYPKEVVCLPRPKGMKYDFFATVIDQIGGVVMYRDHYTQKLKIISGRKLRKTLEIRTGIYERIPEKRVKKTVKRKINKICY